jgi:hypothetical protein
MKPHKHDCGCCKDLMNCIYQNQEGKCYHCNHNLKDHHNGTYIPPHKHDWHCGKITASLDYDPKKKENIGINGRFADPVFDIVGYFSWWACSICGAVKELKSKEVVK